MIRLLVADDHPIVRDGLRQILLKAPDIRIVDEAGTGEEALRKLRRRSFDVVILDIALPGMSGLEVLKRIKMRTPGLPVLMLSMYPEEHYAGWTLKMGASGFVGKENFSSDIIAAIRKVASGRDFISASLAEKIAIRQRSGRKSPHERLSPREYQIMCMLASGKAVGAVARELSLSVKTVDTHRARILEKLDLRNNVGIARYALEHHLIS
ncbi:MAG: response regulator transcription factor [Elusimicrobiota bacterium]